MLPCFRDTLQEKPQMAGGFMVEETTWAWGWDSSYPAWGSQSRWREKTCSWCPQLSMSSIHLRGHMGDTS